MRHHVLMSDDLEAVQKPILRYALLKQLALLPKCDLMH